MRRPIPSPTSLHCGSSVHTVNPNVPHLRCRTKAPPPRFSHHTYLLSLIAHNGRHLKQIYARSTSKGSEWERREPSRGERTERETHAMGQISFLRWVSPGRPIRQKLSRILQMRLPLTDLASPCGDFREGGGVRSSLSS